MPIRKLARAIRFDASDLNIFPAAAEAGEWAISGGFVFSNIVSEELVGKTRQAFTNGFLGVPSFGHTTFVSVATATAEDVETLTGQLATHFISTYGAPSHQHARGAAEDEIRFMATLCAEHATGNLLTVTRALTTEGIKESFRAIDKATSCSTQKLWTLVDDSESPDSPDHGIHG